jgi:hypothetical protein
MEWKKVNSERRKEELQATWKTFKRNTDMAKKEYLESICEGIMEFQTRRYDLSFMKTKQLGFKENQGI